MSLYEGNSGDTHIYLIFHAQFSPFLAHCMLKGYLCKVFKSFRAGGLSDVFCFKVLPMYRLALKMDFGRQNRNKSYVGTIHLHYRVEFWITIFEILVTVRNASVIRFLVLVMKNRTYSPTFASIFKCF